MVEALISVLLERLASVTYHHIEDEVRFVLDAKKEVEEFAAHLEDIRAVLEDAEQRQVKEASVRNWLDKLEGIAYKMDDVLDEWNTEILKQQVEKKEANGENAHVANKKTGVNKGHLLVLSSGLVQFRLPMPNLADLGWCS
ncbi:putative disease resistance protein RGA4 isoform X2 [Prunus avium]|uniref:Disease resistance protein RGA4 isoform X2 n=1 Tax=Prunus avium TaxID=42229 RepID=A0A6P5SB00_PRUAV|nr:putative disease resistance protein RGA4 isoform X2 [Prunus avium]XP_021813060.1 putative disease resistance protein RGA4 isoform X2 [Prunus avium]